MIAKEVKTLPVRWLNDDYREWLGLYSHCRRTAGRRSHCLWRITFSSEIGYITKYKQGYWTGLDGQ